MTVHLFKHERIVQVLMTNKRKYIVILSMMVMHVSTLERVKSMSSLKRKVNESYRGGAHQLGNIRIFVAHLLFYVWFSIATST